MRYDVKGCKVQVGTIRKYVLARALALRYRTTRLQTTVGKRMSVADGASQ